MKILYVTTISDTVNAFLVPHIQLLMEKGHKVDIACNIIEEIHPKLKQMGCPVHQTDFQRSPWSKQNIAAYKEIKKLVVEEKYDIVHVHTPVASLLTRVACRNVKNLQVLYTAHGFHFYKGAPLTNRLIYQTVEKLAARWTDGIITMNKEDYTASSRFQLRRQDAIFQISGVGLDVAKFIPQTEERKKQLRTEYGYHENDFILTYVGELSDRKHQDLLIHVTAILRTQIPNLRLLLVGDGDQANNYKQLVTQHGLHDHVLFLGYRTDITNLMAITDIAVSSSRQEGLPVNVMEAMGTGLPLVVTNSRGNRDLVLDGKNGFVVASNVAAFAEAVLRLHDSHDLRCAFGERSLEQIGAYSLEKVLTELEEIYSNYHVSKQMQPGGNLNKEQIVGKGVS